MSNKYLEKVAILEHLMVAGAAHVAQNVYAKKQLESPQYQRQVAHNVVAGVSGKYPGKEGIMRKTMQGVIVPELGIIKDEAHHAGLSFKDRSLEDKIKAYRNLHRENPGVAKQIRDVRKHDIFTETPPTKLKKVLSATGKATGILGVAVADPAVAALNASKVIAAQPKVKKTGFGQMMQEKFLKAPFRKGVADASTNTVQSPILRKAQDLTVGPIYGMARDAGKSSALKASAKHGIDPRLLASILKKGK